MGKLNFHPKTSVDPALLEILPNLIVKYCGVLVGFIVQRSEDRWLPSTRQYLYGFSTPRGAAAEELSSFIERDGTRIAALSAAEMQQLYPNRFALMFAAED